MKMITFLVLCCLCILASSCGSVETVPTPTESATSSPTMAPTNTPTPTSTATVLPTNTPEPTATPLPTPTPIPAGSETISIENASQIELLDWYSYGSIIGGFFIMEGEDQLGYVLRTGTHILGFSLDGEQLYELPAPANEFFQYRFRLPSSISDNHRFVCLRAEDPFTIEVYDLLTGEKVQTLDHLVNFPNAVYHQNQYGESSVLSLAFNEDGSLLAAAYEDATISIWDVATGEEHSMPSTFEFVTAVAFSQSSDFLAVTSGWSGRLSLFSISNLEEMVLELVQNGVGTLVEDPFSSDERFLISMEFSRAPKYALFDLENMELVRRAGAPGHSPRFLEGGDYLVFWLDEFEGDSMYVLVEIETGLILDDEDEVSVDLSELDQYNPYFDPFMLSVWLADTDTAQIRIDEARFFPVVRMIPFGSATTFWSEEFTYDPETLQTESLLKYWLDGNVYEAVTIQANPDDEGHITQVLGSAAVSEESIFYCIGGQLYSQQIGTSGQPSALADNCGGPGVVAFDHNHNLVAYSVNSTYVDVIDAGTGEFTFRLTGYTNTLKTLRFSGDGNWIMLLAARPNDYGLDEVMLFSLNHENGRANKIPLVINNPVFKEYILDVDLAGDGSYLLAGVGEMYPASSKVNIWNFTGQGARLRTIYTDWPTSITLSKDSQILAVANGSTIFFYSVETSELITEYTVPNTSYISQILFSPDGLSLLVEERGSAAVLGVP